MIEALPYLLLGIFMISIALIANKNIVRIQFKTVGKFLLLMIAVTTIRRILSPQGPSEHIAISNLFFVWWEDAFFTLPLLLLNHYRVSKYVFYPVMIASTVAFASGHLYLSIPWSVLLLVYVPFLSFRYGLRCGLGTVMVCHIMYDLITVSTYAWS